MTDSKPAGIPTTPGAIYARGWNDAVRAAAKTARFYTNEDLCDSICRSIAVEIEKLDLAKQTAP